MKNNNVLIVAILIGGYLYMKNQRDRNAHYATVPQGPESMPSSVGSGTKQIAVGALAGFLQAVAGTIGNNSASGYVQPNVEPQNNDAVQDTYTPYWNQPGYGQGGWF